MIYNECLSAAEYSALQALCSQERDITPPAEAFFSAQIYLQVSISTIILLTFLGLLPVMLCVVKHAEAVVGGGASNPKPRYFYGCRTKQMVSTRASAGGAFPVPEAYAKEASVDLSNGTFKDNGSAGTAGNGASKPADDVSGAMLEPSAFNKNWVRILFDISLGTLLCFGRMGCM